jgi:microcystin-dependent protein
VYQPDLDVQVYSSAFIPVTAGQTYTATNYMRAGATNKTGLLSIFWYNASNAWISNTNGVVTSDSTTGWVRLTTTGTAPVGATQALVSMTFGSLSRGDYHYADAFMFEQASSAGTYFDGASSATGKLYAWSGTANVSTSYEGTGTSQFTTASSGALGAAPQQMWVGTADLGSKHFAISDNAGTKLWDSTGTRGSTQTAREWGLPGGYPTQGLYYDGTNFQSLESHDGGTGMVAYVYPLSKLATSRQMAARYSQYDSVGVTHETAWSPSSSVITINPRQYFWVSSSAPQGTGGAEEPNRIRHYIQLDGAGSYYRQADVTASPWQAYYDTPSTAGATAVSTPDFTGFGNPGAVQTAKTNANGPYVQIRGDGFWRFFTMIGTIWPWAGVGMLTTDVPAGFRRCDGSSLLRTDYPDLATMLGFAPGDTTATLSSYWGAADTTHFNLPNLKGRVMVGFDGVSGSGVDGAFQLVGMTGGHRYLHAHSHGGISGFITADHAHNISSDSAGGAVVGTTSRRFTNGTGDFAPNGSVFNTSVSGVTSNHQHGINSDGSGNAQNLPPYGVIQYLIYTGVNNQPGGP